MRIRGCCAWGTLHIQGWCFTSNTIFKYYVMEKQFFCPNPWRLTENRNLYQNYSLHVPLKIYISILKGPGIVGAPLPQTSIKQPLLVLKGAVSVHITIHCWSASEKAKAFLGALENQKMLLMDVRLWRAERKGDAVGVESRFDPGGKQYQQLQCCQHLNPLPGPNPLVWVHVDLWQLFSYHRTCKSYLATIGLRRSSLYCRGLPE